MNTETHRQLANELWSLCNMLRGPYQLDAYRQALINAAVKGKIAGRGLA